VIKTNQKTETPIHPLLSPHVSSSGLGWKGLRLERYSVLSCDVPEVPVVHHVVEHAVGQHVSYGERPNSSGHWVPYSKPPGNTNLFPNGVRPAVRPYSQTELIVCGLDPEFVTKVAQELNTNQLRERTDVRDESLGYLIRLLESEAISGVSSDSLYVDHLVYALTLRLFYAGEVTQNRHACKGALPRDRLRRVIDRMRADVSINLDLKTLNRSIAKSDTQATAKEEFTCLRRTVTTSGVL
jgi:hypothetical protein